MRGKSIVVYRRAIIRSICAGLIVSAVIFPSRRAFCEDIRTEQGAFEAARETFKAGSYEQAANLLDRFIQTYPGSPSVPQARLLIGQTFFHRHKYLEALDYFEGLRDLPGYAGYDDAILYWLAEIHFKANNFARASQLYREIVDRHPNSAYALDSRYSLGWTLCSLGKYAEALQQLQVLEESGVRSSFATDTPLKIAECLYYLKEYQGLKTRVAGLLRRYTDDPVRQAYLYFYLAEAEFYTDNFPSACAAYADAARVTRDPRLRALAQLGEAWSRIKMKEYLQAQVVADTIVSSDLEKANQDILLLAKAVINTGLGRTQEAQDMYARVAGEAADPVIAAHGALGHAEVLYEKGEYTAAAAGYELALSRAGGTPDSAGIRDSILNGLAWTRLRQGDYRAALEEFEKIARDARDPEVQAAALCQVADAYQDTGDFDRAQKIYEKIVLEHPKSAYLDYARYRQGILLLRKGDAAKAADSFNSLIRDVPGSELVDEAVYSLGLAYFQQSAYQEASDALGGFRDTFTKSPFRAQALYLLGVSLRNVKRYEEALDVFSTIVAEYESDRNLCLKAEYQIADCYYRGSDEKQALAMFKRLRAKYPDTSLTADIIWWLGDYYFRIGKPDIACRYFTALIDDFPASALAVEAHYALAVSLEEESLHQEAIDHFKRVIQAGPSQIAAKSVAAIGEIYAKKSRFVEAAAFMSQHMDAVPSEEKANMHFAIAGHLESGKRMEEAVEEYLKAAYLFPEQKDTAVKSYFRAARIYESVEKFPEAAVLYDRLIGLNTPEAKIARERLDALSARLHPSAPNP